MPARNHSGSSPQAKKRNRLRAQIGPKGSIRDGGVAPVLCLADRVGGDSKSTVPTLYFTSCSGLALAIFWNTSISAGP